MDLLHLRYRLKSGFYYLYDMRDAPNAITGERPYRLKTELARRVAVELARRTPYVRAVAWPQASIAEPALTLPIDVQRFEAEGFERVTLEAVWTLRQAGRDVTSRRFVASEAVTEPGWDGLAAAHGRLVDALAADIAARLPAP